MREILTILLLVTLFANSHAQTVYYVNDNAAGTETGENWENAFTTIRDALQSAIDSSKSNTIFYIKEGQYTKERQANGDGIYSTIPSGDVSIIGGFPESATGTDICGYDPLNNHVDIVSGSSLYVIDKSLGKGSLKMQGLRFDDRGGTVAFGSILTSRGTTPEGTLSSHYYFEDLVVTNQSAHAFLFRHYDRGIMDTFVFRNCFFKDNDADTPIRFEGDVDKASIHINDSDFINSNAAGEANGGAIRILGDDLKIEIKNSIFCSNVATGITLDGNSGGAIYIRPDNANVGVELLVDSCDFIENRAEHGGAIYLENIALATIKNSYFESQESGVGTQTGIGGGIGFVGSGTQPNKLVLENNTFYGNYGDKGGAVGVSDAQLLTKGNKYHGNTSKVLVSVGGGAISIDGDDVNDRAVLSEIRNDIFTGNHSPTYGGAIMVSNNSNVAIVDSEFSGNYTVSGVNDGGAVRVIGSKLFLEKSKFKGNYAQLGGALSGINSSIESADNIFIGNHAGASGGAVYLQGLLSGYDGIDYIFQDDKFLDNYIDFSRGVAGRNGGGAMFVSGANNLGVSENVELRNLEFLTNNAINTDNTDGRGGALFLTNANSKLIDCKFDANNAREGGGACFINSSLLVTGTTDSSSYFRNNTAYINGGAIRVIGDDGHRYGIGFTINGENSFQLAMENTEFYKNIASKQGTTDSYSDGGGALNLNLVSSAGIYNCSFIDNEAWVLGLGVEKGGGAIRSTRAFHVGSSKFSGNKANGNLLTSPGTGGSDIISTQNTDNDPKTVFDSTDMQLVQSSYRDFTLLGSMTYATTGLIAKSTDLLAPTHVFPIVELKNIICPVSESETFFKEKLSIAVVCETSTSSTLEANFADLPSGLDLRPDAPYTYVLKAPSGKEQTVSKVDALAYSFSGLDEIGKYRVTLIDKNMCTYEDSIDVVCGILPVELTNFGIEANGCEVNLYWNTAAEENFSHYEVEWSSDAINFETINVVNGHRNPEGSWYNIKVSTVVEENYYRLKMVDLDGSMEYSKIEYLKTDCVDRGIILYPNPAMDILTMKFYPQEEEDTEVVISNVFGKERRRLHLTVEMNTWNNLRLDISDFSPGTYIVRIGKETQTLVVMDR